MDRRDQLLLGSIWNNKKTPQCCPNETVEIITEDSSTIDFSGNGTVSDPLTADVIISPTVGNTITIDNGLFVPAAGGVPGVENGLSILGSGNAGLGGVLTEPSSILNLDGNVLLITNSDSSAFTTWTETNTSISRATADYTAAIDVGDSLDGINLSYSESAGSTNANITLTGTPNANIQFTTQLSTIAIGTQGTESYMTISSGVLGLGPLIADPLEPSSNAFGSIYYNSATNSFRGRESGGWTNFLMGSANRGLTYNTTTNFVQLGQTVGQVGNPAALTSDIEIPLTDNFMMWITNGTGGNSGIQVGGTALGGGWAFRVTGDNNLTSFSPTVTSGSTAIVGVTPVINNAGVNFNVFNVVASNNASGAGTRIVRFGTTSLPTSFIQYVDGSVHMGDPGIADANRVASSKLTIISTTQGFLPPKMTTTQRDAIVGPVAGLMIYNTTTNKLNVFTTVWEQVTSV